MNSTVFYFKKALEHNTKLECSVILMPLHEKSTVAYSVNLSVSGSKTGNVTVHNITSDRITAEQIFNHICCKNVMPENIDSVLSAYKAI